MVLLVYMLLPQQHAWAALPGGGDGTFLPHAAAADYLISACTVKGHASVTLLLLAAAA